MNYFYSAVNSFGYQEIKECAQALYRCELRQSGRQMALMIEKASGVSNLRRAYGQVLQGKYLTALKSTTIGTGKLAMICGICYGAKQLYTYGYKGANRQLGVGRVTTKGGAQESYICLDGTTGKIKKKGEFNELGTCPDGRSKNCKLPKTFRSFNPARSDAQSILTDLDKKVVLKSGKVVFAGSGQFSRDQFETFVSTMREKYGSNVKIEVIDLRAENHLFCDGNPIAHVTATNDQNEGMTNSQIMRRESIMVNKLFGERLAFNLKLGKRDQRFNSTTCKVAETEQELVKEFGADYTRVGMLDHQAGTTRNYIDLVKTFVGIKKEAAMRDGVTVVLNHCKGGKGRTGQATMIGQWVFNDDDQFGQTSQTKIPTWWKTANFTRDNGGKDLAKAPKGDAIWKLGGHVCREESMKALRDALVTQDNLDDTISKITSSVGQVQNNHPMCSRQVLFGVGYKV